MKRLCGKGIQKEETYNKYGDDARKIGILDIGEHGDLREYLFSEIPDGGP